MEERTLKALEFDKILDSVAAFASSEPARAAVREIRPFDNIDYVRELIDEVEEADKIAFEYATNLSFAFDNIDFVLDKAAVMSVLSMGELLRVSRMLRVARNVRTGIAKVPDDSLKLLKRIATSLYTDKNLEDEIDNAIVSETEMHDRASEDLRQIRMRIRKTGEAIKSKLYSYITSPSYSKYLQDNIVTVRVDRYVIPVKAECRSSVPGLIHDQSASGQTLYIEPMAVVELNNTLKTHIIAEQQEIERILRAFTLKVSVSVDKIRDSFDKIVKLDTVFAKAYYANAHKCCKPVVNDKGIIDISKGRHPLIAPEKVVPTDIRLGKDFDLLFVTGPNTGGKTVALKLVGLLSVLRRRRRAEHRTESVYVLRAHSQYRAHYRQNGLEFACFIGRARSGYGSHGRREPCDEYFRFYKGKRRESGHYHPLQRTQRIRGRYASGGECEHGFRSRNL